MANTLNNRKTRKLFGKLLGFLTLVITLSTTAHAGLFSISDQQAIDAGKQAHADVMKQYGEWRNSAQQARINRLGRNLDRFSQRPEIHYRFYLLNSDILNAMATPDGSVHVTRGLATHFTDDRELSFIIGHEMTHVEKRHGKQQIEKAMETQAGGTLLLILLGKNGGKAAQIGVGGAAFWLTMKYSRDFEYQADEGGMRLLKRAGIDPGYGPKALKRLFQLSKDSPNLVEQYFGSHPLPPERIKHAEDFANSLKRRR